MVVMNGTIFRSAISNKSVQIFHDIKLMMLASLL